MASEQDAPRRSRLWRWTIRVLILGFAIFVLMQAVPYGWWHENPPVTANAPWPDATAEQIARTSCYSCHSNETEWPLYSYIAPASWVVRSDVENGRHELNFSEWDRDGESDGEDAAETIAEGSMPPSQYTLLHPAAKLDATERNALIAALRAMEEHDGEEDGGSDE